MTTINFNRFLFITFLSALASGCTIFLPAHTSSNKKTGEKVSLTPLKCNSLPAICDSSTKLDKMCSFIDNYKKTYHKDAKLSCDAIFLQTKTVDECKPPKPSGPTVDVAAPLALLASAAVGLATDFVKKKFEEEKTLYTAQYTGRLIDDKYWQSVTPATRQKVNCILTGGEKGEQTAEGFTLKPNYIGFELKREITGSNTAALTQYGLMHSSDGRFFQVKPLYFEMPYAKAKVLSNQLGTWFFPPTLLMKLFNISNNTVDVELDFNMEAYWTDKGKEFNGPKTIASFKTNISGYDLSDAKKLDSDNLQNDSGWMLAPPISDAVERYVGTPAGNFKVTVKVTERDTSEAIKIIETSEEWVSKGGQKLQDIIEEKK
ncbi:hypothetical protein [Methylovulum miyakonense]|uniref:hypothetical protein n=1 Tax=Methylovulum miyakonense TaxID=645578 RepID=UPI00039E7C02|nr:hypothetical protein [Methylovulum miyakonense]